jgi:hypothetical protein
MTKPVREVVTDDPTVVGSVKSLTFLQAGTTATSDAVVEAFMGLAVNSVLKEYFLKNLGRHICGYEDGLLVLGRGCSELLSFVAQYRQSPVAIDCGQSVLYGCQSYV